MNRTEYLSELERLLSGMPEEERQAAVSYYADYFEDAGDKSDADVISELGSPEKVAESIRADYYGNECDEKAFEHKDYMEQYGKSEKKPWTSSRLKLLLVLAIAIVLWPVTLGIGAAVLSVIAAAVGIFAAFVIAGAAIMGAGIIVALVGLALLVIPPAGFIVIGAAILIFVLGMIITAGSVKLCIVVYPAMLKGFVNLCRRPFYGKAVS